METTGFDKIDLDGHLPCKDYSRQLVIEEEQVFVKRKDIDKEIIKLQKVIEIKKIIDEDVRNGYGGLIGTKIEEEHDILDIFEMLSEDYIPKRKVVRENTESIHYSSPNIQVKKKSCRHTRADFIV